MNSPYELLAGLALLREKKRLAGHSNDKNLESWPALLVRLGNMTCILRQNEVDEIIARGRLSLINGVADWVIGLGYFRGQLLTVLDGPQLLKLHRQSQVADTAARIMVVGGEDEWFGVQVDELIGIRHVWSDNMDVAAPAEAAGSAWLGYVERWIKLEHNTVPVLQIKQLILDLEQTGELETTPQTI